MKNKNIPLVLSRSTKSLLRCGKEALSAAILAKLYHTLGLSGHTFIPEVNKAVSFFQSPLLAEKKFCKLNYYSMDKK